jgi:hypothetical protein
MAVPSQIRPHVGGATEADDANGAAGLSIYLMNRQRGLIGSSKSDSLAKFIAPLGVMTGKRHSRE